MTMPYCPSESQTVCVALCIEWCGASAAKIARFSQSLQERNWYRDARKKSWFFQHVENPESDDRVIADAEFDVSLAASEAQLHDWSCTLVIGLPDEAIDYSRSR